RGSHWMRNAAINATGAVATAIVTLVIAWTKFADGAWIVVVVTPLLVAGCLMIKRHYRQVAAQTTPETPLDPAEIQLRVIVPIGSLNLPAQQALAFAQAVSSTVIGVHVTDDFQEAQELQREWETKVGGSAQLIIIESPYRSLVGPLLAYLD